MIFICNLCFSGFSGVNNNNSFIYLGPTNLTNQKACHLFAGQYNFNNVWIKCCNSSSSTTEKIHSSSLHI